MLLFRTVSLWCWKRRCYQGRGEGKARGNGRSYCPVFYVQAFFSIECLYGSFFPQVSAVLFISLLASHCNLDGIMFEQYLKYSSEVLSEHLRNKHQDHSATYGIFSEEQFSLEGRLVLEIVQGSFKSIQLYRFQRYKKDNTQYLGLSSWEVSTSLKEQKYPSTVVRWAHKLCHAPTMKHYTVVEKGKF